jgi:alkylhydroperoxidase family enzyme
MAIVPYVSAEELGEDFRELLVRPINLFRGLANSPELFSRFHALGEWIRWDCKLDPRERELLILAVGYLTNSPYEFSHHVSLSAQFGVVDDDITALIAHLEGRPSDLGERERLLATAAQELTVDRRLDDDTVAALHEAFDDARIVDIVAIASFYNMVVRVLGGLRIDNEPEYESHLDRFPLPNGQRNIG